MKIRKLLALGGMMGCASLAFAANEEIRQLDIVIRDFQPDHSDFENFSEEFIGHGGDMVNFAIPSPGYDLNDWFTTRGAYHSTCGNKESHAGAQIGQDGKPMAPNLYLPQYLQTVSAGPVLQYGECSNTTVPGTIQRGFKKVIGDVKGFVCSGNNTAWANDVYYTPGMVKTYLDFDPPGEDGKYDMYDGVHIRKANEACDNSHFEEWYEDVKGTNLRTNATMDIPQDPVDKKYFVYDYNYNNGGYSPLDSIDALGNYVQPKDCNASIQPNGKCEQFGPQSFSFFCPPYGYQYAVTQADYRGNFTYPLCVAWLANGGPKNPNAAMAAFASYSDPAQVQYYYNMGVNLAAQYNMASKDDLNKPQNNLQYHLTQSANGLASKHIRNYAFTMMGYASFKYKSSNQTPIAAADEVFEFAGDDDMWIFVDGVLAVDLGGTHLAAPGSVNIKTLAQNGHGCHPGEPLATYSNCNGVSASGWADDTWHHLHFFYADRQTDGSNIYIRTSLAELAPSRYGQPTVGKAVVKVDEDGNIENSLFLNTPIADSSIANMVGGNADLAANAVATGDYSGLFASGNPSIVVLRPDPATGLPAVYGYYVTGVTGPTDKGSAGFLYQYEGVMLDAAGNVVATGLLGGDAIAFNFPYNPDTENAGFDESTWALLESWNKKTSHFVTATSGKSVEGFDPPADWAKIDYTATAVLKVVKDDAAPDRPQFTTQADKLTASAGSDGLPNDMTADLVITQIPAGVGDPLTWANDNAEDMMIHSGDETIGGVAPVRTTYGFSSKDGSSNSQLCYSAGDSFDDQSCVNFGFVTTQPFRINVRVFDHLGHFVSQYTKAMDAEAFGKAMGANTSIQGCSGYPMYGSSGAAMINLKMYPVAQSGRLLATGPYIYQVTVVKETSTYCYMSNGTSPTVMVMPYLRTTETQVKGYRRGQTKKGKKKK